MEKQNMIITQNTWKDALNRLKIGEWVIFDGDQNVWTTRLVRFRKQNPDKKFVSQKLSPTQAKVIREG